MNIHVKKPLQSLFVRIDSDKERFCWGARDEVEGQWLCIRCPAEHFLAINHMCNQNPEAAVIFAKAAYAAGLADEGMLPNGGVY